MQINGDEFVKKVQEQERLELQKKLSELEDAQVEAHTPPTFGVQDAQKPSVEEGLDNLLLQSPLVEKENKKKYIILGTILAGLFISIVVIVKMITGSGQQNEQFTVNSATPTNELNKIESLPNSDTTSPIAGTTQVDENFQKIINERVNSEEKPLEVTNNSTVPEVIQKVENIENKLPQDEMAPVVPALPKSETKTASNDSTISNESLDEAIKKIEEKKNKSANNEEKKEKVSTKKIEDKKTEKKEKIVQKEESKKIKKEEPKSVKKESSIKDTFKNVKTEKTISKEKDIEEKPKTVKKQQKNSEEISNRPKKGEERVVKEESSGNEFYIQVAATSKDPSDKFTSTIQENGYKHKTVKTEVNGKTFNKVLVGPFKSKEQAKKEVEDVKEKLELEKAYIIKY